MHRLGAWAALAVGHLKKIESLRLRVAAAMGISAGIMLLSGILEAMATAVFYGSLIVAVGCIVVGYFGKSGNG